MRKSLTCFLHLGNRRFKCFCGGFFELNAGSIYFQFYPPTIHIHLVLGAKGLDKISDPICINTSEF